MLSPFGLSDHFTMSLFPKVRNIIKNRPKVVKSRDTRQSKKKELGRVISTIDWSYLDLINSCEEKVTFLIQLYPTPSIRPNHASKNQDCS